MALSSTHRHRLIVGTLLAIGTVAAVILLEPIYFSVLTALLALLILREWVSLLTNSTGIHVTCLLILATLMLWVGSEQLTLDTIPGSLFLPFAAGWWFLMFVLIAVYHSEFNKWRLLAYLFLSAAPLVIAAAWFAIVYLHEIRPVWLLYLFAVVVVADVAAYYSGRTWGKRKLAPLVSPGKTVAGLWGALGGVLLLSVCVAWISQDTWLYRFEWILVSLLTALVCIIGDLAESVIKRYANKKDSGSLLPGHGGLLDRTDSLLAAAPLFLMALLY